MGWTTTKSPERSLSDTPGRAAITIWDSANAPPQDAGVVYAWNGHADSGTVRSLLAYVESNSQRLRDKYLSWIHDLGESKIGGQRLIDHLVVEDGLSAWWMTLLVEQSPWLSPSIMDVVRLFAIEEIVARHHPDALRLVSANAALNDVLADWCLQTGIAYRWRRETAVTTGSALRRAYRALPKPIQAIVDLARYLRKRWPLRTSESPGWFGGEDSVLLCSSFFQFDATQAHEGRFHSRYWEGLHGLMQRMGLHPNWLHLYQPHDVVPNARVAMEWLRGFNDRREDEGFHTFLEASLSWPIVRRAIIRWAKIAFRSARLHGIERVFRHTESRMSLWPLMRSDWESSTRGTVALFNQLSVQLFDKALGEAPYQRQGLYLFESQAWERAMIHAWRKHGHGRLIGVAHSTVRFWDLRYFTDVRTLRATDGLAMPRADAIAVNGELALDAYRLAGFPNECLVACEALRYGYLNNLRTERRASRAQKNSFRVLILGDYMSLGTTRMLKLLEGALPGLSESATFAFKPHPNYHVDPADYPGLHLSIVKTSLGGILSDFDVAYSSNMTAAAIDGYLAGLPVVVMLDEQHLNFSPLRGQLGVQFVSRPDQLADALETSASHMNQLPDRSAFLFLDPDLPRWRQLLMSDRPDAKGVRPITVLTRTKA